MKLIKRSCVVVTIIVLATCCSKTVLNQENGRSISIPLNQNWSVQIDGENDWKNVNIPHTPRIEPLVVNDQWQGTITYKKTLDITDSTKIYQIEFEGVMHEAIVSLNGSIITKHAGGYLPFVVDITKHINYGGTNELIVEVNNLNNATIPPGKTLEGLDFNFYGGIYREVQLHIRNKQYISNANEANILGGGGTLIHFEQVNEDLATGTLQVHVVNKRNTDQKTQIVAQFSSANTNHSFSSEVLVLAPQSDFTFRIPIEIDNPKIWSIENAQLYNLSTHLVSERDTIQTEKEKIGIRSIRLTKNEFFLNDKKQYLRGTNRHQEYPYVGYAISKNANRRDAIKIKNAGFDFVRLSHYPQDESFLDACDELGILVMNAIPGWQYYSDDPIFLKNSYQDIRDMVRRDRNHPSVVFWEVSLNESSMTENYMNKANEVLKQELPFADTYSAGWIDHKAYDLYIPARQHSKGPNYWNNYKTDSRPLFIAEYGDWEYYAHNAGFNQAAYEGLKEEERTSRQLRAHGEKRLLQQALNFQEATNSNRKGENAIGDANWLMFDYNRGYTDDLEASGISDIFRIPKFAYYFYQSQRPPYDTLNDEQATGPMVKIATYWNENSSPEFKVYSNCEEVALYLGDQLIERKRATIDKYSDQLAYPPFTFDLKKFTEGQLTAHGYIDSEEVAQDIVSTPQKASDIELEADLSGTPISENQNDVIFVYAKIVDENGTLVTASNVAVTFNTTSGEIIGQNPVKAQAGIATVLLRTEAGHSGMTISASVPNLYTSELRIGNRAK